MLPSLSQPPRPTFVASKALSEASAPTRAVVQESKSVFVYPHRRPVTIFSARCDTDIQRRLMEARERLIAEMDAESDSGDE